MSNALRIGATSFFAAGAIVGCATDQDPQYISERLLNLGSDADLAVFHQELGFRGIRAFSQSENRHGIPYSSDTTIGVAKVRSPGAGTPSLDQERIGENESVLHPVFKISSAQAAEIQKSVKAATHAENMVYELWIVDEATVLCLIGPTSASSDKKGYLNLFLCEARSAENLITIWPKFVENLPGALFDALSARNTR